MKSTANHALAIAHLLLISPALVFMGSLMLRNLQALQNEPAQTAQQIIMWYAGRMWTLWLLLLAIPLSVLVTGCLSLLRRWTLLRSAQQEIRAVQADWAARSIFVTTIAAAIILTIVILHMAAN